ncbi:protein kinase [Streptomyces roseirectus]|uniref:Protein kinase n=1 Tax=Streptomyces roseirectus TaxID=2768066 RepID=A0A7H0IEI9_9ACTN|nr:serine/threonine-protein kinase [Streptomyces roseirectus]QNP71205.1 protein kinase [Streptomyces roseirectus]
MEKLGEGDPMGIPPGFRLRGRTGEYQLVARLGGGGMGHVYLARSDRGRTVAVKLVRSELATREEFRERFRQEVAAARRVGGHWTAPVLDADTEAGMPWVATGYVAGPSLQQVVGQDHGPLPERSVRILAAGLAHALQDIHAAGIVHRDLKPSNVMVTIDGPRVIDFGIARALEGDTPELTLTGAMVGSPGFMAPEQVRGDRITPACDVFCLGSVLAYAATGSLPFGNADSGVHALMFRIAEDDPDLAGVPEGIADLVLACLRKDPAARPSLGAVLEGIGAEDTVSDGRSRDPWLPSGLVAQLGRHAVRLLDIEGPGEDDAAAEAVPEHSGPRGGEGGPGGPFADRNAGPVRTPSSAAGPVAAAPAHPAYGHAQQHPQPAPQGEEGYGYPVRPAPTGHDPASAGHDPAPGPTAVAHGYPSPVAPTSYGYPPRPPYPGAPGTPHPHPMAAAGTTGTPGPYNPPPTHPHPSPSPYNPTPYAPYTSHPHSPYPPEDPAPRRNNRTTALLIVVALVVAIAAGSSVYALLNGDGTPEAKTPDASPTVTKNAPQPAPPTPQPSDSATPEGEGAVPAAYLGSWTARIDSANGANTRELVIAQGDPGAAALTLVAEGPGYHCEFTATLTRRPATESGPLTYGPSRVTTGRPLSSCTPGAATEVTLLPDGTLQRVNSSTGEQLTYTKR